MQLYFNADVMRIYRVFSVLELLCISIHTVVQISRFLHGMAQRLSFIAFHAFCCSDCHVDMRFGGAMVLERDHGFNLRVCLRPSKKYARLCGYNTSSRPAYVDTCLAMRNNV